MRKPCIISLSGKMVYFFFELLIAYVSLNVKTKKWKILARPYIISRLIKWFIYHF